MNINCIGIWDLFIGIYCTLKINNLRLHYLRVIMAKHSLSLQPSEAWPFFQRLYLESRTLR